MWRKKKKSSIKRKEKEFKERFPFNPKNSFKNNNRKNKNIHQKLYEDNKILKVKNENRLKKVVDEIKNNANHPISIHNDIQYLYNFKKFISAKDKNMKRNNSGARKKKKYIVEYYKYKSEVNKEYCKDDEIKKIEELYNEYKNMKDKLKNLKKRKKILLNIFL